MKEDLNKWRDKLCLWIKKTEHIKDNNYPQIDLYM